MSVTAPHEAGAESPGLFDQFGKTLGSGRRMAADLLGLVGLEARLAGISAARLLGMGVAAGFALMAAWLLLQAALIVWLNQLGLNLGLAFLLFALLNGALTGYLIYQGLRLSRNLSFAATRRALREETVDARTEG